MFNLFKFADKNDQKTIKKEMRNDEAWYENTFFGGKLKFEEYNPDQLAARHGFSIYKKMLRDPQIKASYNFLVDTIISRKYFFDFDVDDVKQKEVVDFFNWNLESKLEGTFLNAMKAILLAKVYGFSLTEKILAVDAWQNKQKIILKALKQKDTSSFTIKHDVYGNVFSFIQDQNGTHKDISKEKFIYFVYQKELEPIWGESDFFTIYRPWWEKTNILKFRDIYLERIAGGFLVATPRDNAPNLSPSEKRDFENAMSRLTQSSALRVPNGFDVKVEHGINTSAFEEAIEHCDKQITRGLLVPNMIGLGDSGNTGSFAQAEVHFNSFFLMVAYQGELLSDVLNEQLFVPLARLNFDVEEVPIFKFDPLSQQQKRESVDSWIKAFEKGAVSNTEQDELKTRSLLDYPVESVKETNDKKTIKEESKEPEAKKEEPPTIKNTELKFEEDPLNTPLNRLNFKELERAYNKFEEDLIEDSSEAIDKAFDDILREIKKQTSKKNDQNVVEFTPITPSSKKQMQKAFKSNLRNAYIFGNKLAKEEIRTASKKLSESAQQKVEEGLLFSKKMGVKYGDNITWRIFDFVEGIKKEDIDKVLASVSFNITGDITKDMEDTARTILNNGIVQNQSFDEIVDNVERALAPLLGKATTTATGKVELDPTERSRVNTIARTNLTTIFNQSFLSVYTDPELEGFVEAFQYSSILDSRTTEFCESYDNFTRPVDDEIWATITPPNHFNCRARIVPVTAVDEWNSTKKLPTVDKQLVQPGAGFGTVST
jgi:SPP1 gp7 family putative phage head morphogenesis protein